MAYTYDDFDNINSWFELRDFCEEYGLTTSYDNVDLNEIVDDYWVKERVMELASECCWNEIYMLVNNLEDSSWEDSLYHNRGYGLEALGWEYFDDTKAEVLVEFRDEGNTFEDEDEEADDENEGFGEGMMNQYRPSQYTRGVRSVYGRITVQDCYEQPDVVGCSAEDFGKFFGF